MQFSVWLEKSGVEKAEIARKLGISRQSIYNLIDGAEPKLGLIKKIEKLSAGKVTVRDWAK